MMGKPEKRGKEISPFKRGGKGGNFLP